MAVKMLLLLLLLLMLCCYCYFKCSYLNAGHFNSNRRTAVTGLRKFYKNLVRHV